MRKPSKKVESAAQIDIILMDIQRFVVNGLDATEKIREIEKAKQRTPIIAMTAAVLESERVRALESGMDSLIAKPSTLESLYPELSR